MLYRVLGPLEARARDGRLVTLTAAKPRTLLAALLLNANRPVRTDRLAEALWPRHRPASAMAALRTYASSLRQALGLAGRDGPPQLLAGPDGYRLTVAADDLDLSVFDALSAQGRRAARDGDLAMAVQCWQRALVLWRGPPLEDVTLDGWVEAERGRLSENRLTLIEDCSEARLATGEHADLVPTLAAAVAEQPLRERLHALQMLALYRSGRQADALAVFRDLRHRLVGDLGIEPSPPLQLLHRQILSADAVLDAQSPPTPARTSPAPASVTEPTPPHQLPPDVTTFVGRGRELATLQGILSATGGRTGVPLVGIAGPAGVGKSALAVRFAHQVRDRFAGGQLYVDLRGATVGVKPRDPLDVLIGFLRALGVDTTPVAGLADAVAAYRTVTSSRELLVVLDNARDAAQLGPLLPTGSGCCALFTSRQSLVTVDGADHVPLDVLPVAESVLLLGRIAGAGRLAADPGAALHIAERCGHLPLALRIVGARLAARPSWSVRALADRLTDVRQILDELHVGDVDARTSFQASYQILADGADPADRAAADGFALLGTPEGAQLSLAPAARLLGMTERAAEQLLERLVDSRLLDSAGPGRYRLHDLLRAFAREQAADRYAPSALNEALDRMLSWYVAAAWQTFRLLRPGDHRPAMAATDPRPDPDPDPDLDFTDADGALDWLDSERANLLAAVDQASRIPGDGAAIAVQLAQALFAYLHVRGHWHELVSVNETARRVARAIGDEPGVAQACRDLGAAHELIGNYPEALRSLREGLAIFRETGDRRGEAECLSSIGAVHDSQGNLEEAVAAITESLQIRRELHDRHGQAISLGNLGPVHARSGDAEQAVTCLREAITIFRRLGNRAGEAASLNNLAEVYAVAGSAGPAEQSAEEALTIFRILADRFGEACALANLGRAQHGLGRSDAARVSWRTALGILEGLGLDGPAARVLAMIEDADVMT